MTFFKVRESGTARDMRSNAHFAVLACVRSRLCVFCFCPSSASQPGDPSNPPDYVRLEDQFTNKDIPAVMPALGLGNEPLPLLWTGDFIPKNTEEYPDGSDGKTDFVVGEFNCSCVGISPFGAACGVDKDLKDVPDAKFIDGYELTCLMGIKAIEMLDEVNGKFVLPKPRSAL